MSTRIRTVYLIKEAERAGATSRPTCYLDCTASGAITYGVRYSARTLKMAREGSQAEFLKLRRFAEKVKREGERT